MTIAELVETSAKTVEAGTSSKVKVFDEFSSLMNRLKKMDYYSVNSVLTCLMQWNELRAPKLGMTI